MSRVGEFDILFQGCFTTHADIKRLNRVCENTLYTTEYIASIASLYGYTYPSEGLKNCWQELLFNQFHDIFDDCAKKPTYIFACKQLNGILDKLSEIAKCSLAHIKQQIKCSDLGKPILLQILEVVFHKKRIQNNKKQG